MFFRLAFLLISIVVLAGCNTDTSHESSGGNPPEVRLSFDIDESRRYTIPDNIFFIDQFMFSPIDQKDKIWLYSHELDLLTGEWIELKKKFGTPFNVHAREDNVWVDSVTANVYIGCFYDGLVEYNARMKSSTMFEVRNVNSLLAVQDFIFFGTARGLYKYQRATGKIALADNFPDSLWVTASEVLSGDSLRLSTSDVDLIYRISDSQITATKKSQPPLPKNVLDVSKALPSTGFYPYRSVTDDSLTWLHHQGDLYIKSHKNFLHVSQLDSGHLRQLKVDSKFIYLLFNHQFVILNKANVINHSEVYDAESYQAELKALYSLTFEKLNLRQRISRVDSFQNIYGNSRHPDIANRVLNLNDRVGSFVSEDNFREEVEKAIQEGSLPEKYMKSALINLIVHYTTQANLKTSLQFSERLHKKFPDYTALDPTITFLSRIKSSMDSIDNLAINADQKLYLLALQKQRLVHCQCGWFGESYIDDSIVAKSYREILENYPSGDFADNAAFYLMNREYMDEVTNYSDEWLKDCKQFLKKYPDSDLKVDAQFIMVEIYTNSYDQGKELLNKLEKAKEVISNLSTQTMTDRQKDLFLTYKSTVDSRISDYKLMHKQ